MRGLAIAAGAAAAAGVLYWIFSEPEGRDSNGATTDEQRQVRREREVRGRRGGAEAAGTSKSAVVTMCSSSVFSLGADGVSWHQNAKTALRELLAEVELIVLVERCTTDEEQALATTELGNVGVIRERCVFSELDESVVHVTRHLNPSAHIDTDSERASVLSKFGRVVLVAAESAGAGPVPVAATKRNIAVVRSVDSVPGAVRALLS
eukprot:m.440733 g.440733  ORF g.440733 m.440733 type:complete len:207 (+) comp18555_c0_seq1:236-856(+)